MRRIYSYLLMMNFVCFQCYGTRHAATKDPLWRGRFLPDKRKRATYKDTRTKDHPGKLRAVGAATPGRPAAAGATLTNRLSRGKDPAVISLHRFKSTPNLYRDVCKSIFLVFPNECNAWAASSRAQVGENLLGAALRHEKLRRRARTTFAETQAPASGFTQHCSPSEVPAPVSYSVYRVLCPNCSRYW